MNDRSAKVILSVDLGTSGMKVALITTHGQVLGWDYVNDQEAPGGLSRAATILQTLRAQYPDQVIVVDTASVDGSGAMVRSDFPAVTCVTTAVNPGST